MKIQKLPIEKTLLVLIHTILEKKICNALSKSYEVNGGLYPNTKIFIDDDIKGENFSLYDLIIIEGSYAQAGNHFEKTVNSLGLLLSAGQQDKLLLVSFANANVWETTCDSLGIPIVYIERLIAGIGEELMEQKKLLKTNSTA